MRHHAETFEACYCSEVPLKGDSVLPIQLLTLLSTYVQSLEPSIKATTKLGLVETGSN
jgi:hypothetical protein